MVKKKKTKNGSTRSPAAVLSKPSVKKTPKKAKRERSVNIEKLRELMKTHKPPQSWYDEDHTGLY
jgi:hypothetical protein